MTGTCQTVLLVVTVRSRNKSSSGPETRRKYPLNDINNYWLTLSIALVRVPTLIIFPAGGVATPPPWKEPPPEACLTVLELRVKRSRQVFGSRFKTAFLPRVARLRQLERGFQFPGPRAVTRNAAGREPGIESSRVRGLESRSGFLYFAKQARCVN